jgi:exodeoxyribonuclease V alpha subunit
VAVLGPFVEAGLFDAYEVQLAASIVRLDPAVSPGAALGLALAARAPRFGHVCAELGGVADLIAADEELADRSVDVSWPTASAWVRELSSSSLVTVAVDGTVPPRSGGASRIRPLVLDGERLYLQRYWHYEVSVADDLVGRVARPPSMQGVPDGMSGPLARALEALFGPLDTRAPDLQRLAVMRALTNGVSILAGGPGTGKTHTIARILAAAHRIAAEEGKRLEVALAAPTGKAAARMRAAVSDEVESLVGGPDTAEGTRGPSFDAGATTVHRLLGWRPGTRFRHHRDNPLPHDLVIVDETSMVALPLMAKLLDAMRPEARLVLVGDPFQLASIEAGTVMGDVVGPAGGPEPPSVGVLAERVTVLRRMHRFAEGSVIAELADAVRSGETDAAMTLLDAGDPTLVWVDDYDPDGLASVEGEVTAAAAAMVGAALAGDAEGALAAAHRTKVLTATRWGPLGLYDWSDRIEAAVTLAVPEFNRTRRWPVGRPVIVTRNDPLNRVANGDVGLVVNHGGVSEVAFDEGATIRWLAPSRLEAVESWWAMTIHKSQGSEFPHAVVSLPEVGSPILTRELLYTAVTRARDRLTIVGSRESLRYAIDRPVARASGLRGRLWPS